MDSMHRGSRRVYRNALPHELCQELLWIQRSLAVVGYRPNVQSLTLYELVLACPQLLPAVARARQIIWDAVEEQFGLPCQVWPETTSLIKWTSGASIGWHYDANRPYLAARHFSAVAYLSTQGYDFQGGTFCFQSGAEPLQVVPAAGTLLLYTADDSNIHSVEEVTAGERSTLTMWFTMNAEHQEDVKVLEKLRACAMTGVPPTMYLLECGLDVRVSRLQQRLGLTVVAAQPQQQGVLQRMASSQATSQTSATSEDQADQQHYVVQCLTHSPTPEVTTSSDQQVGLSFTSLQQALMVVAMMEWRMALPFDPAPCSCLAPPGAPRACAAGCSCRQQPPTAPQVCRACALLAQLPSAVLQLEQHLDQAATAYERLLPSWHQLGALVPAGGTDSMCTT